MSGDYSTKKRMLDPVTDKKMIDTLSVKSAALRKRMLILGKELKIRLHYGAMFSCSEILVLLYAHWMRHDPQDPHWPRRDRFVLSKGHAAPILYGVLSAEGYFSEKHFEGFRRLGSILQGHPDRNKTPGIDCTTGSLGQGMPVACGMALAAKAAPEPYHVYTLISDGECNEGSIWEAAMIAANLSIDRLTVLLDWNQKSSYGVMKGRNDISPLREKWESFGWHVEECDGHDFIDLSRALFDAEKILGKPSVVLCKTVKNKGIPYGEKHHTRSNYALTEENFKESIAVIKKIEKELYK